jgi:hypothetical protein
MTRSNKRLLISCRQHSADRHHLACASSWRLIRGPLFRRIVIEAVDLAQDDSCVHVRSCRPSTCSVKVSTERDGQFHD